MQYSKFAACFCFLIVNDSSRPFATSIPKQKLKWWDVPKPTRWLLSLLVSKTRCLAVTLVVHSTHHRVFIVMIMIVLYAIYRTYCIHQHMSSQIWRVIGQSHRAWTACSAKKTSWLGEYLYLSFSAPTIILLRASFLCKPCCDSIAVCVPFCDFSKNKPPHTSS